MFSFWLSIARQLLTHSRNNAGRRRSARDARRTAPLSTTTTNALSTPPPPPPLAERAFRAWNTKRAGNKRVERGIRAMQLQVVPLASRAGREGDSRVVRRPISGCYFVSITRRRENDIECSERRRAFSNRRIVFLAKIISFRIRPVEGLDATA